MRPNRIFVEYHFLWYLKSCVRLTFIDLFSFIVLESRWYVNCILTFRRQEWYECILHSIANMYCAVRIPISCIASLQITQMYLLRLYIHVWICQSSLCMFCQTTGIPNNNQTTNLEWLVYTYCILSSFGINKALHSEFCYTVKKLVTYMLSRAIDIEICKHVYIEKSLNCSIDFNRNNRLIFESKENSPQDSNEGSQTSVRQKVEHQCKN